MSAKATIAIVMGAHVQGSEYAQEQVQSVPVTTTAAPVHSADQRPGARSEGILGAAISRLKKV